MTIFGTGLAGITSAHFGDTLVSRRAVFGASSDSEASLTAPPHSPGAVHVTVTTPAGTSPATADDQFTYQAPTGGQWSAVAPCMRFCGGPAIQLPNGKVLVVGGGRAPRSYAPVANAAQLFDPVTGAWSLAGHFTARYGHTATLLRDGTVLVAGGLQGPYSANAYGTGICETAGGGAVLAEADIYHPATNSWSPTGPMHTPRCGHTATLLTNGDVLVAGGAGLTSAEVYHPASGTWSAAGSMSSARYEPTATRLRDGRVLVAGGYSLAGPGTLPADPASQIPGDMYITVTAELYDPSTRRWSDTGSEEVRHFQSAAVLLQDGKVLVAGGDTRPPNHPTSYSELYDPATGRWTPAAPLHVARYGATATLLPNGTVLVVGGITEITALAAASAELYDPRLDHWRLVLSPPVGRAGQSAVLLEGSACGNDCGAVLLVGGTDRFGGFDGSRTSAELYRLDAPVTPATSSGAVALGAAAAGGLVCLVLLAIGIRALATRRRMGRRRS